MLASSSILLPPAPASGFFGVAGFSCFCCCPSGVFVGKWTRVWGPSTLSTLPIGTFLESSTKMTSFKDHSSSSTFSGSSLGADLFCRLALAPEVPTAGTERLPSEHVELAGLGGGGIEAESYSSFCFSFSLGSSGNLGLLGGWMILNRHTSVMDQAELSRWPTLGTPPETVNPIEPG